MAGRAATPTAALAATTVEPAVTRTAGLAVPTAELAAVLTEVRVAATDKSQFFQLIATGASAFHLLGWSCESGEAGDVLDAAFHSGSGGLSGSENSLGLADARLDRLIDESNASDTVAERTQLLQAAAARIAELHVALPLVLQAEAVTMSRRIRWEPPRNSALLLSEVSETPPSE